MSDWDELSIIHGKLLGCSNDAVATFWRLVTWARGPMAGPRPGFVTRDQIMAWSGGLRGKKLDTTIQKLVDAGKPKFDHGLLEPAEGGWWIHDFDQWGADVEFVARLAPEPVEVPAVGAVAPQVRAELSAARSAAGRLGGQRSVASRRASKQTAQPPKQTPEANRTFASTFPKQTPEANPGSSSPVRSLSSLEIREIPKENPPPKDLSDRRNRDVCFDEEDDFKKLNLKEKASAICQNESLALEAKPHTWDEVIEIARTVTLVTKVDRVLGPYATDKGVQAAVKLLASWDVETILPAIPEALKGDFWRHKSPGLAQLSVEVIEDALRRIAATEERRSETRRLLGHPGKSPPGRRGELVAMPTAMREAVTK